MTVSEVKNVLLENMGRVVVIKYSLGRNKYERYNAKIKDLYNNVFTVELDTDSKEIRSFTYSDVITKTIKIDLFSQISDDIV